MNILVHSCRGRRPISRSRGNEDRHRKENTPVMNVPPIGDIYIPSRDVSTPEFALDVGGFKNTPPSIPVRQLSPTSHSRRSMTGSASTHGSSFSIQGLSRDILTSKLELSTTDLRENDEEQQEHYSICFSDSSSSSITFLNEDVFREEEESPEKQGIFDDGGQRHHPPARGYITSLSLSKHKCFDDILSRSGGDHSGWSSSGFGSSSLTMEHDSPPCMPRRTDRIGW